MFKKPSNNTKNKSEINKEPDNDREEEKDNNKPSEITKTATEDTFTINTDSTDRPRSSSKFFRFKKKEKEHKETIKNKKLNAESNKVSDEFKVSKDEDNSKKLTKEKVLLNKKRTAIAVLIGLAIALVIFVIALTLSLVLNNQKTCDFGYLKSNCSNECGVSYESSPVGNLINYKWPSVVFIVFRYKTDMPYNGKIVPIDKTEYCTGTLINDNTVLTAASCLINSFTYKINDTELNIQVEPNAYTPSVPSMFTVYLGVSNKSAALNMLDITPGYNVSVSRIIMHKAFDRNTNLNNIALFKLFPKANMSKIIQIACLPTVDLKLASNANASAVGWSDLNNLEEIGLNVYESSKCLNSLSKLNSTTLMCAGDKPLCNGYVGTPLFVKQTVGDITKYVLAGITNQVDTIGCVKNSINYFTQTIPYLDWIKQYSSV